MDLLAALSAEELRIEAELELGGGLKQRLGRRESDSLHQVVVQPLEASAIVVGLHDRRVPGRLQLRHRARSTSTDSSSMSAPAIRGRGFVMRTLTVRAGVRSSSRAATVSATDSTS